MTMSNEYNKPKGIAEVGESFEELLLRKSKMAKSTAVSNAYGQNKSSMPAQQQTQASKGFLSAKAEQNLQQYQTKEQKAQILRVWSMLMQAFGSKFTYFFGDEPDRSFMAFAASLTADGYKRLEANLYERLDEDKEWPPSLVRLSQLADSPTKETMYEARQRLFHNPVPVEQLNRVERYIKRYKMTEVRNFSDKYFESEFNRRYTQWFREVVLADMDIKIAEKQDSISDSIDSLTPTEHDKRREAEIAEGRAFDNKYGERIKKMLQDKVPEFEEISEEDALTLEQQKLADRIRKDTENR